MDQLSTTTLTINPTADEYAYRSIADSYTGSILNDTPSLLSGLEKLKEAEVSSSNLTLTERASQAAFQTNLQKQLEQQVRQKYAAMMDRKAAQDQYPKTYDYVTAAQGKLYIGGIQVDDCFDIQYQYRESKEPVYGYNSKHFNYMVPGTVIGHGAFTINYKQDSYLYQILQKISKDDSNITKQISNTKTISDAYQAKLKEYKVKLEEKNAAIRRQKELDEAVVLANTNLMIAEEQGKCIFQDKIDTHLNAIAAEGSYYQQALNNNPNFANLLQIYNDEVNGPNNSNSLEGIKAYWKTKLEEANKYLSQAESNRLYAETALEEKKAKLALLKAQIVIISSAEQKSEMEQSAAFLESEIETLDNNLWDIFIPEVNSCKQNVQDCIAATQSSINDKMNYLKDYLDSNADVKQFVTLSEATKIARVESLAASGAVDQAKAPHLTKYTTAQKAATDNSAIVSQCDLEMKDILTAIREAKSALNAVSFDDGWQGRSASYKIGRAEDTLSFNMAIEYNGEVHKILRQCTLTGHGHVLSQSGECIKEYYTFLFRAIERP